MTWIEEFNDKFKDLTHVGCGGENKVQRIPCHTVKQDVIKFILKNRQELVNEISEYAYELSGNVLPEEHAMKIRDKIKEKYGK